MDLYRDMIFSVLLTPFRMANLLWVLSAFPVLSILLWPLVVYHELIQRMYTRLEPVLMKLDYSMKAETLHLKHEKRSKALPFLCSLCLGRLETQFG